VRPRWFGKEISFDCHGQGILEPRQTEHVPVVIRLKDLQSADFHAIYGNIAQCCDIQLDQVFGSLDEPERAEALGRLAQQIGNRYQESFGPIDKLPEHSFPVTCRLFPSDSDIQSRAR
jgi:hypothetical protein